MDEDIVQSDSESDYSSSSEYDYEEEPGENSEDRRKSNLDAELDLSYNYHDDEPDADEEWLTEYNNILATAEQKFQAYSERLEGKLLLDTWCKCGNCSVDLLVNAAECQCCKEVEACIISLESEPVVNEVGSVPVCIVLHPGFSQVCLQPWPLRLAAGKYKTKTTYRQTGSEERFDLFFHMVLWIKNK